ncbi:nuclear transport factor 2 family protein [Cryobacterium sp. TMT1-66-1]|uniref:nuclear transport factor 2 family protein n=1 Tax=Cryobacterium sp. TMT1-66-1 TaxID=1259242 RepID=UPI001F541CBA|nr:nuclear transport factor 2 family protein [Cryobacterium sp. TMT1-66-1]
MTTDEGLTADALAAADHIIEDFGHHRRDAYFARFSPQATFLFYNVGQRLESRKEYEQLWLEWESDGFTVISCTSTNRRIQLVGSVAVFTHDVETVSEVAGERSTSQESETIVLSLTGGIWLGIHEHLSVHTNNAA